MTLEYTGIMSAIVINNRWRKVAWQDKSRPGGQSSFRYPPRFWRRCFVGIALAMSGVAAGLLFGLLLPPQFVLYSAAVGLMMGFFAGFLLEGK